MESGIYAILQDSKILYIGQSCNISKRWRFHKWQLSKGIHANTYLQRLYTKNNSIEFVILERGVKRENLTLREIYYINKLKPLCNFVLPSKNDTWLFSKERNKKISISHTGKPKTAEHRKNISLSKKGVNNPKYGLPAQNAKYLEFNGQRKNMSEWAKELGLTRKAITKRLQLGWTLEKTLTTPKK